MLESFINNVYSDHLAATQKFNDVLERLGKLQEEQESSKEELRTHLNEKTDGAIQVLIDYLQSPDTTERFCKWNSDELPDVEGSWEVTESTIVKLIQNRLQKLIEEWEEENQHFAEARKSVVTLFLRKYSYLENELGNLEVDVSQIQVTTRTLTSKTETVEEHFFNKISDFSLSIENKILLGITVPFLVPALLFGAALTVPVTLLGLPVIGIHFLAGRFQEGRKKSSYKEDRSEFVRKVSQKYLEKVATHEALLPVVEDQLKEAMFCLNELQAKVPMLLKADAKLCQQLMDESQSKKDTEAKYRPLKEKCERLRGELGLYGALEIRGMSIAWNDLDWDVSEDVYLEHTLPPGIYQGRISKGGYASCRQVSLKVYKDLLTSSNVIQCLADEAVMR